MEGLPRRGEKKSEKGNATFGADRGGIDIEQVNSFVNKIKGRQTL